MMPLNKEIPMKYRLLGNTGLRISVIGLGTWQYGGEWGLDFTPAAVTPLIRQALELGVDFIDTAECYGDHLAERFIGQALADLGAAGKVLLATKFGHHFVRNFELRTEPRSGPAAAPTGNCAGRKASTASSTTAPTNPRLSPA